MQENGTPAKQSLFLFYLFSRSTNNHITNKRNMEKDINFYEDIPKRNIDSDEEKIYHVVDIFLNVKCLDNAY